MSVTNAGAREQASHPVHGLRETRGWSGYRTGIFPPIKDARSGWERGVQRAIPLSGTRGNGRKAGLRGS